MLSFVLLSSRIESLPVDVLSREIEEVAAAARNAEIELAPSVEALGMMSRNC